MPSDVKASNRLESRPLPLTRTRADRLASVVVNLDLSRTVELGPNASPAVGDIVAVRVLEDSGRAGRNSVELCNGDLVPLEPGAIVVGALGARRALRGFLGDVPNRLQVGDRLHVLNLGGVIGVCVGGNLELEGPTEVEFLGAVWRDGRVVNLSESGLEPRDGIVSNVPVVLVAGTCMNSGKTEAASELIRNLSADGRRIAAAKLTGVACLRDLKRLEEAGAVAALSFLDCGVPSTVGMQNLAGLAETLLSHLDDWRPDLVVLEMGDGLLGFYEVETLFAESAFMEMPVSLVFCASDFVGAWGGARLLEEMGYGIDVLTGAVTDSRCAVDYLETRLGIPAANARNDGQRFSDLVRQKVEKWKSYA